MTKPSVACGKVDWPDRGSMIGKSAWLVYPATKASPSTINRDGLTGARGVDPAAAQVSGIDQAPRGSELRHDGVGEPIGVDVVLSLLGGVDGDGKVGVVGAASDIGVAAAIQSDGRPTGVATGVGNCGTPIDPAQEGRIDVAGPRGVELGDEEVAAIAGGAVVRLEKRRSSRGSRTSW